MKKEADKKLGIYIHIPFCIRKCLYCDFLSAPAGVDEQARYVQALCREIEIESGRYPDYEVESVYLGGGTPSLFPGEWVERIMDVLRRHYRLSAACEISMEANPGTLTWDKLKAIKAGGVNRLSIGLQSANDRELSALGRIHTWEDFLRSYELAAQAGFGNLNVDLMSGIPGQTLGSWEESLNRVRLLSPHPKHISAYSLIIEEGTPFFENRPELPEEDTEREMYKITRDILSDCGYGRYEISNYALPGYECRHNISYWRRKNYLGFGIGAASLIENVRFRNTSDRQAYEAFYLDGFQKIGGFGTKPVWDSVKVEKQLLSIEEQMEEFLFLGLRMSRGVNVGEFFRCFGRRIDEVYPGIVDDFCQKGLLQRRKSGKSLGTPEGGSARGIAPAFVFDGQEGDREAEEEWISLTDYGVDISNYVMVEFLLS